MSGNRLNRQDLVVPVNSETYAYDESGQIKPMQRTDHLESWNYDATENWLQYVKNGTTENRTHNVANELQDIATHDANGNMTTLPGLANIKYDAWNRMVRVGEDIRYDYNGRNQRI